MVTATTKPQGMGLGKLAKDTVIYGATNIFSKFFNWMLAPFHIRVLASSAEYGVVTNLYAWVSVILVVLTLGLETGLFRFMNSDRPARLVYATCLKLLGAVVLLFLTIGLAGQQEIASSLGYASHPEYIGMFVVIVAIDALLSLPFAYLRYEKRALAFAGYKFLFILLNILLNLFFFIACPWLLQHHPAVVEGWYRPEFGVGYIFVANLIATGVEGLCMFGLIRPGIRGFDRKMVRPLVLFSLPLMLLGVMGNFNRMAGQILLPRLFDDSTYALTQIGIYGGCLKIAVVMVMFMQAFRFAYDPFVFSKMKEQNAHRAYKEAMNYFLLFTCLIFMAVMYNIDLFKHIVSPDYYEGLRIVPIVMAGEIVFGIYYNLSMWYKLSDRTYFGTLFSLVGLVITVGIILIFAPTYSYVACAWASLICNIVMMLLSYILGRKYYPIPYDESKLLAVAGLTILFYYGGMLIAPDSLALKLTLRGALLLLYLTLSLRVMMPHPLRSLQKLLHR